MSREALFIVAGMLLVAGATVLFVTFVTRHPFKTAEIISLAALCVSLEVAVSTCYFQFLRGPRLEASFSRVDTLPMQAGQKIPLMAEILVLRLKEDPSSQEAVELKSRLPSLEAALGNADLTVPKKIIQEYLSKSPDYNISVPNGFLRTLAGNKSLPILFHVPLAISNNGSSIGIAASLVMIAEELSNPNAKWAFTCMSELSADTLLRNIPAKKDVDYFKSIFSGVAVGPKNSQLVNAVFMPLYDTKQRKISEGNLPPGTYNMRVFGFDGEGNKMFVTKPRRLEFTENNFLEAIGGAYAANFDVLDRDVLRALGEPTEELE